MYGVLDTSDDIALVENFGDVDTIENVWNVHNAEYVENVENVEESAFIHIL
jgi:hypothetical protein